jgi:hypothetical protein
MPLEHYGLQLQHLSSFSIT